MFKDKMQTEATPERVYTLCKIVAKNAKKSSEVKDKMEPEFLKNNTVYFSAYRTVAEELGLISVSDNLISLAVDPAEISSYAAMRAYINRHLEEHRDGSFYQVTKAYFEMGNTVLTKEKNISNWHGMMSEKLGRHVDTTNLRAWRFWVTYLGFGYLHDMFILPCADGFLQDNIMSAGFVPNHRYSFGEFIEKLRPKCNILLPEDQEIRVLNYGVSNGLRTLHDMGVIKLEHILDQKDIWSLYPVSDHQISGTVTNITICK